MTATALLPALVLGPLGASGLAALLPTRADRWRAVVALVTAVALVVGTATVVGALIVSPDATLSLALGGWDLPLAIALRADGLSAAFLGLTATVGLAVTVYAAAEPQVRGGAGFWPLWLALWAALNGVYLAGDLFNLYVTLELVTVAAVALVALGGRSAAGPALRYLFVAVVGSLLFLLAVALVYAQAGTLDLDLTRGRLEPGPLLIAVLALVLVGMGAKMALFPLHSWLPVAHPAAPAAVSAVLSALVIKAAVLVLWRVWYALAPSAGDAAGDLALAAGVAGSVAVFWGGLLALRQRHLKTIIAYSTVAQVGYLALVLALASSVGPEPQPIRGSHAWVGGVSLVLAHGLAKSAMFLAAGTLVVAYGSDRLGRLRGAGTYLPMTVATIGIAGVSLAGLPPTFGFVAKWQLLIASIETGQWWWVPVLLAGGLLTVAYTAVMLSAMFRRTGAAGVEPPDTTPRRRLSVVPFLLALASIGLGVFSGDLLTLIGAGGDV